MWLHISVTALETLPLKSYSNSSRSLNLELPLLKYIPPFLRLDETTYCMCPIQYLELELELSSSVPVYPEACPEKTGLLEESK